MLAKLNLAKFNPMKVEFDTKKDILTNIQVA